MVIKDTPAAYGTVSRVFHWVMAAAVFALFGVGWWMVGLDYYSPYDKSAPDLHRSAGMLLLIALLSGIALWLVKRRSSATLSQHEAFRTRRFGQ